MDLLEHVRQPFLLGQVKGFVELVRLQLFELLSELVFDGPVQLVEAYVLCDDLAVLLFGPGMWQQDWVVGTGVQQRLLDDRRQRLFLSVENVINIFSVQTLRLPVRVRVRSLFFLAGSHPRYSKKMLEFFLESVVMRIFRSVFEGDDC